MWVDGQIVRIKAPTKATSNAWTAGMSRYLGKRGRIYKLSKNWGGGQSCYLQDIEKNNTLMKSRAGIPYTWCTCWFEEVKE